MSLLYSLRVKSFGKSNANAACSRLFRPWDNTTIHSGISYSSSFSSVPLVTSRRIVSKSWFSILTLCCTSELISNKRSIHPNSCPAESRTVRIHSRVPWSVQIVILCPFNLFLGSGGPRGQLNIHNTSCCSFVLPPYAFWTNKFVEYLLFQADPSSAHSQFLYRTHHGLTSINPRCVADRGMTRP